MQPKVEAAEVPRRLRAGVEPPEDDGTPDVGPWALHRKVHGVLGVHVGDLLGGGEVRFQRAIKWLRHGLEFGVWGQTKFRCRGRVLEQSYDKKSARGGWWLT